MGERLLLLTTCTACALAAAGCEVSRAEQPPAAVRSSAAPLARAGSNASSGKLRTPRRDLAAVLLGDGRVLLAGGETAEGQPLADVELYEPLSGTWSDAAPLLTARSRASATLLASGQVLVSGGMGQQKDGSVAPLDSQELFDPATGQWRVTGPMSAPRADHSATRLLDGRVLLAGGQSTAERVGVASAEVYSPQVEVSEGLKEPMAVGRFAHSALRLPSGEVLIAGGDVDDIVYGTARTERFQPDLGAFVPQAPLADLRFNHTATLLLSGKVALVGGRGSGARAGSSVDTAYVWSEPDDAWLQGPWVTHARESHTAALLPSGRLLVAGGWSVSSPRTGTRYTEVPTWEVVTEDGLGWEEHPLARPRARHASTLLPTGEVLLAGGEAALNGAPVLVVPTELLEVSDDRWAPSRAPGATRAWATSTLLNDGRVLVLGETKDGDPGELHWGDWSPEERAETLPLPLAPAHREGTATLLETGNVLVLGGLAGAREPAGLAEAALFEPEQARFTPLPPPLEGRGRHSATLLPNGNVLVAGGVGSDAVATARCELFDPVLRTWRELPSLSEPRAGHSATLLPDGRVLLAGGVGAAGEALHSVELFDPRPETWTRLDPPGLLGREHHQALLGADGSVLLVGGREGGALRLEVERLSGEPLSAEVLDSLPEGRLDPALALLLNGRVLVAGGSDADGNPLASALLLDARTGRLAGPAAAPAFARGAGAAATLLPDGRVRLVGGGAPAELYDEGRGAPDATRPVLASLPPAQPASAPLLVKGAGLTGVGEAAGGTPRSPATDVPLLLLRRSDGSLQRFAATSDFGASSLRARLPPLPGGPHWVFPVTNAVVGVAKPLQLGLPRGERCEAADECASGACASGVCCDRACAGSCGSGTCLAPLAEGTGSDGGIMSVPDTYAPSLPDAPTAPPTADDPPDAGGEVHVAAPPRFSASTASATARCAQLFVSAPTVQGDGPFTFALEGPAPEGLQLDATSGELRWSPTRAQAGHYRVQRVVRTQVGEDVETLELDVACEGMKLAVGCGCNSGGEAGSLAAAGALLVLLRRRRRVAAAARA